MNGLIALLDICTERGEDKGECCSCISRVRGTYSRGKHSLRNEGRVEHGSKNLVSNCITKHDNHVEYLYNPFTCFTPVAL